MFKFVENKIQSHYQPKNNCKIYYLLHLFYILNALSLFQRMLVCFYFLRSLHSTEYFAYDHLLEQLYSLGIDDGYLYLAFSPVIIFFTHIHWVVHLMCEKHSAKLFQVWCFIYRSLMESFEVFALNNLALYSEDSWSFAKETKKRKQFLLMRSLKQIGFVASVKRRKSRKNVNFTTPKYNHAQQLVALWLTLEGMLLYMIFSSTLKLNVSVCKIIFC